MFCTGMSTFAIIMLLMLGLAIQSEYRYVGKAWIGGDEAAGIEGITHAVAAKNCFEVAGIYAVTLGLSILCMAGNAAKAKLASR